MNVLVMLFRYMYVCARGGAHVGAGVDGSQRAHAYKGSECIASTKQALNVLVSACFVPVVHPGAHESVRIVLRVMAANTHPRGTKQVRMCLFHRAWV
jgi:hypothetical protein